MNVAEAQSPEGKIETIDYDGVKYAIEDLPPRIIEGFKMLIKLQNEIVEQSYQLKKSQAAQTGLSMELKKNIVEDKVKPAPDIRAVPEPLADKYN
jgi:hypothetical protein